MNNQFYTLKYDDEGIAWLHMNQHASAVNVLSREALEAFEQQLITIAQTHPRGLVIRSDKPSGFIAGADVKAFSGITEKDIAEAYIRRAHQIFNRLESLSFPTVALVHGFCLGGGLELALACRYRIARDDPATRLGFPEVRLGIFPGFGGTVRSLRQLGPLKAMELMLSGRTIDGKAARKIGLVDATVPERQLENMARKLVAEQPRRFKPAWWKRLPEAAPFRPFVAMVLRKQVAAHARPDHYPAPYRLIEHWQKNAGNEQKLYQGEASSVAGLITGQNTQNLVRVFLLQARLKSLATKTPDQIEHVHVVGGGTMGGDIAAWCALKGLNVTLQDRAPEYLVRAIESAHKLFKKHLKDRYRVQNAMDRLIPDHRGFGVTRADMVIEAIYEDVRAKQALYAGLESRLKPGALLATNTSSIPLEILSETLEEPRRLVGLHFFNPVARMPLVEIITQPSTDEVMTEKALSFTGRIGKLPLPVKSSPGFLVNRVLMPYLLEAVTLFEEGISATVIDRAAREFGMPTGPMELADSVGLDVCLSVAEKMAHVLHNEVPESLIERVNAGNLGRKTGKGYYNWNKGKVIRSKATKDVEDSTKLAERMILRLVNEAVACLREGVVEDEDLVDAGVIYGTGFAPFRGGPICYAHQRGSEQIQKRLQQLEHEHGKGFHADNGWATVN